MASSKLQAIGSWLSANLPGSKEEAKQFVKDHKWEILATGTVAYLVYKVNELRKLPPGPYGLPLIGYMIQASTAEDLGSMLKSKYGDIASVQVGSEYV
jgi:hypothetical protein